MGSTATGKSTLAGQVRHILGAPILSTAQIKEEIVGCQPDCLNEDLRDLAYAEMLRRAAQVEGLIVLDASFHRRRRRHWLYRTAQELQASLMLIHVVCSRPELIEERIQARKDLHHFDAHADTLEVHEHISSTFEDFTPEELPSSLSVEVFQVDTGRKSCEESIRARSSAPPAFRARSAFSA